MSINVSLSGLTVGLTLGSVNADAVDSKTQEIVGVANELPADVIGLCGQAVMHDS